MNYIDRVVCFIDILGFSSHISKTNGMSVAENEQRIAEIADAIKSMEALIFCGLGPKQTTRKITQFSDSIVISFDCNEPQSVFWTLMDLQQIVIDMTYRGFLCRGGIVSGKIIHNENMVFGPAMVDAYTLESRAANYPRIIMDKRILELEKMHVSDYPTFDIEQQDPTGPVGRDSDGMYYVNYFSPEALELGKKDYDFYEYMGKLKILIENGLKTDKQDLFVKYSWLRQKFNKFLHIAHSNQGKINTDIFQFDDRIYEIREIPN